jgi:hypothetical protein
MASSRKISQREIDSLKDNLDREPRTIYITIFTPTLSRKAATESSDATHNTSEEKKTKRFGV